MRASPTGASATADQVAIIGMAVLLPGARQLSSYWRNLRDGADSITDVPTARWDEPCYAPDTPDDPRRPDQLIALQAAADALADAGGKRCLPDDRARIGVILGRGGYLTPRAIGLVPNLAASRIANRLDLRGPAYTVDAACASSLVAVDSAVAELARGRCDVVLAGGVHHGHDITLWSTFTQLGALSPSQQIHPLDRAADGLLIGAGTGVVVLKRLTDAVRNGDRIYAVIRGIGISSDGAELAALTEVFGAPIGGAEPGAIGSVQSMIGHTMPAAGAAGLIKAALAVYHATLLPTLHCTDPHPALAQTRCMPITAGRPWDSPIRRAGVNAFGFGGINAHMPIEQAPGASGLVGSPVPGQRASRQPTTVAEPERVLRLAADSPAQLAELLDVDDDALLRHAEIAQHAPGQHAAAGSARLGIVAPTAKHLAIARKAVAKQQSWRGRGDVWFSAAPLLGRGGGKLAFVFPGLDAEFTPRVAGLAAHFGLPELPATPEFLVGQVGRHSAAVVRLGILLHSALGRMNITPDAIAGHSLGEWTGMTCAGFVPAVDVDQALEPFDQEAIRFPRLAFAVLGAPAQRVSGELSNHPDVLLSHDNAPRQSIICGPPGTVDELVTTFRRRGVVAQVLPFQSGFHTPMLAPYLDPIRAIFRRIALRSPRVPMWSATTASEYPQGRPAVCELVIRHLLAPVRFRPLIEAMHTAGFTAFVQLGCGQLGSLISDTLRGTEHLVIAATSPQHEGLAQLSRVATALWSSGWGSSGWGSSGWGSGWAPAGRGGIGAELAGRGGIAAELAETLRETEDAVATVLAARHHGAAQASPRMADAPAASSAASEFTGVLRVSTDTMPYLRDHCLVAPRSDRPDWPDEGDRHPVVPATTLIAQLADVAEQVLPGATVVTVRDVRLNRRLVASPPIDVMVSAVQTGRGALAMSVGQYATATVELAVGYPVPAPAVWSFDPANERLPTLTAAELYRDRWMCHGPAFQGVTELSAIGKNHVRGVLTTPAAPGGLLDSAGQLLGYWIKATHWERPPAVPVAVRAIRFFGSHPALGARLACSVRITALDDTMLDADMQLVTSGQVWAQITGWTVKENRTREWSVRT